MDNASVDQVGAAGEVASAAARERARWVQEGRRQKSEAELWQRRIDLAERHREFDLATEAAQRARRHAGLALAAERHVAELEAAAGDRDGPFASLLARAAALTAVSGAPLGKTFVRPESEQSIDARLAAIKAASQAAVQREGP
jgi:hypothetical protein